MLLGSKRSQESDHNWCVVLKSVASEIDRRRIVQQMTQTFSLSDEEAADVVNNTPIIILDNLNRVLATKAKDYFNALGAETLLTNDLVRKRKYYRTVWPEPPNLAFLAAWEPSSAPKLKEMEPEPLALSPEEALHELQVKLSEPALKSSAQPVLSGSSVMEENLKREIDHWRSEYQKLREEISEIRRQPSDREDRLRELEDIRRLLNQSEERYRLLKSDFDQSQSVFERKVSHLLQESETWRRRFEEMAKNDSEASRKMQGEWEERFLKAEERYRDLQQKHLTALQDLENQSREVQKMRLELARRPSETQVSAVSRLTEKEERLKKLVQEQQSIESEIRQREEAIRKILTEQESVEREILKEKGVPLAHHW